MLNSRTIKPSIVSSCSVLEQLTLICFSSWYNLKDKVIHVCAPKLLRFTIYEYNGYPNCIDCHVMVHGADLKHYDHTGIFQIEHCVSSSTSLDSARIVIIFPQYVRKEYHRIHRLLACLSSAKDLTLLDHTLEVLKGEELGGTMPMFKNLTRLEIDIIYSSRFNFNKVLQMLQLCPILEVLIINEGIYYQDMGFDNIDTRPLSLPSHLKIIEVHKFGGGAWSLNVVKVFLKYAPALKKIIISPSLVLKLNVEKMQEVFGTIIEVFKRNKRL